jgi:hypothetical protein
MKKIIITLTTIFFVTIIVKAQDYGFEDGLVLVYQEEHPKEYSENILNHAQDKWGETNYDLVKLEVKHQIVSQFNILKRLIMVGGLFDYPGKSVTFKSEMKIIKSLILKWSYPGWADVNQEIVSNEKFGSDDFKNVHCDWVMILTDYDAILVIRNSQ